MEKQLLRTIEIVNYPKQVMTAKSIRSKYWEPKHKLLMAFFSNTETTKSEPIIQLDGKEYHTGHDRKDRYWLLNSHYCWKKVGPRYRLWDTYNKEYVVKNIGEAGTERWKPVSDYYQNKNEFLKGMIVKGLKEFWITQLQNTLNPLRLDKQPGIVNPALFSLEGYNYPVTLEIHYLARIPDNGDLDNYSLPYHKTLIDSMVKVGILKDDRIRYVNGINLSHTPIEEGDMGEIVKTWGQSANDVITIKIYGNANKL